MKNSDEQATNLQVSQIYSVSSHAVVHSAIKVLIALDLRGGSLVDKTLSSAGPLGAEPEARPMVGGAVAVDDDREVAAALFK